MASPVLAGLSLPEQQVWRSYVPDVEEFGSLLAGFRLEKHHNQKRRDKRNGGGKLGTGNKLVNIYHSSKYRSNRMAIPVVSIQNNTWYVKPSHVCVKGISINSAAARPVRIDDATFKLA